MTLQGWLAVTKYQWLNYADFYQQGLMRERDEGKLTGDEYTQIVEDRNAKLAGAVIGGGSAIDYVNGVSPAPIGTTSVSIWTQLQNKLDDARDAIADKLPGFGGYALLAVVGIGLIFLLRRR